MPTTLDVFVREWQIDVLIDWHVRNNAAFFDWYLTRIDFDIKAGLAGAKFVECVLHKYTGDGTSWGENDLRVEALRNGKRLTFLCETKIDAGFGVDELTGISQPTKYKLRCELNSQQSNPTYSVLLAPAAYLCRPGAECFDARISFEEIDQVLGALSGDVDLDGVISEHREFLKRAASQRYEQQRDSVVGEFWDNYRTLVKLTYPRLAIQTKIGGSRRSKDVYFKEVFPGWKVKHRLDTVDSRVAIELSGYGGMHAEISSALEKKLEPTMRIRTPPQGRSRFGVPTSVQISIDVPPINTLSDFEKQVDSVRQGVAAVERLQTWCLKNESNIRALIQMKHARR